MSASSKCLLSRPFGEAAAAVVRRHLVYHNRPSSQTACCCSGTAAHRIRPQSLLRGQNETKAQSVSRQEDSAPAQQNPYCVVAAGRGGGTAKGVAAPPPLAPPFQVYVLSKMCWAMRRDDGGLLSIATTSTPFSSSCLRPLLPLASDAQRLPQTLFPVLRPSWFSSSSAASATGAATDAGGAVPPPPTPLKTDKSAADFNGRLRAAGGQCAAGPAAADTQQQLCLAGDVAGAAAVAHLSVGELLRALVVYSLCTSDFVVRNSEAMLALSCRLLGSKLTFAVVRNTFFKVFCGGENLEAVRETLDKLQQRNIGAVLDYAAEQKIVNLGPETTSPSSGEDSQVETAVQLTLQTIDLAAERGGGFVATKITALGDTKVMTRANDLLQKADHLFAEFAGIREVEGNGKPSPERLAAATVSLEQFVSGLSQRHDGVCCASAAERLFSLLQQQKGGGSNSKEVSWFQWSHFVTPMTVGRGPQACLSKALQVLSDHDVKALEKIRERFFLICAHSAAKETPPILLVDAEQSSLQTFIHHLAVDAQKQFNSSAGLVQNTYQAYLKDTLGRLKRDVELASRFDFILALKLVRGAYVKMEHEIAKETGAVLQVHDSVEHTHACYDACVRLLFEHIDRVELFVASHNAESCRKATALLVAAEDKNGAGCARVVFGQLYGMGDAISHGLSQGGFSVFKYLPFGPVDETIPYLVRRAQENGGMLGGAKKEVRCILQELRRRLMSPRLLSTGIQS